jgi:hypothetical protein
MGLRIIISDIPDEENTVTNIELDDDDWNWDDEDEGERGAGIVLTGHVVKQCKGIMEDIPGRSIEQSRAVNAFAISGIFNIADQSEERANISTLFNWFKKASSDRDTYKKLVVSQRTGGNVEFKNIIFEKAFVVSYSEEGTVKSGTIEFSAFIRKFEERMPAEAKMPQMVKM